MGSLRQKLNMRWPTFDIAATVHGAGPVGSPEMTRYRRAMPVQPYNRHAMPAQPYGSRSDIYHLGRAKIASRVSAIYTA
jgi:hypothetical protein